MSHQIEQVSWTENETNEHLYSTPIPYAALLQALISAFLEHLPDFEQSITLLWMTQSMSSAFTALLHSGFPSCSRQEELLELIHPSWHSWAAHHYQLHFWQQQVPSEQTPAAVGFAATRWCWDYEHSSSSPRFSLSNECNATRKKNNNWTDKLPTTALLFPSSPNTNSYL